MKMHLICATDNLRPAMCHVQVKDGFINATNAHILGRVDARALLGDALDELPSEFYIHATEWKKLVAGKAYAYAVEGSFVKGITKKGVNYAKFITPDELDGRFPDVMAAMPNVDQRPETVPSVYAFNPELLSTLCEALDLKMAMITSCGATKVHYVACPNQEHAFGIIMPLLTQCADDCIRTIKKLQTSKV